MKKIPYQNPDPSGTERSKASKEFRDLATEVARLRPHAITRTNGEEIDFGPDPKNKKGAPYTTNFTKGLAHDINGVLKDKSGESYRCFVEAINSRDRTLFEKQVGTAATEFEKEKEKVACCDPKKYKSDALKGFFCTIKNPCDNKPEYKPPVWRGWESPRSGHVYELEGPDAGSVAMTPAPRICSSELVAEMAEVYAMAILRDVSFKNISNNESSKICDGKESSLLSPQKVVDILSGLAFYKGENPTSSNPEICLNGKLNSFESNRRSARTQATYSNAPLSLKSLFRGSSKGCFDGPYISQFMYIGNKGRGGLGGGTANFPGRSANHDPNDGFIVYGNQIIDQRVAVHKNCLDYMTNWASWLDVQNGAKFNGENLDLFEPKRRFIITPRDLATYVHYDALYQAYLNACLILLGAGVPTAKGVPTSKGFPEPSPSGRRDAFATFGGPHILSLVTEVATRCLKSVRRQKFNYHRRCRPETIGGRLTLSALKKGEFLGKSKDCFEKLLDKLPDELLNAIKEHNKDQNSSPMQNMRRMKCPSNVLPAGVSANAFKNNNYLLPMAFPEGSPMHPAYGAGHATVAGGCVTMLKAFFDMYDPSEEDNLRILKVGNDDYYEPDSNGTNLVGKNDLKLTVQGELNKLAANISIGRNMAGVHYYSDYYDSLRMGERIAVGILMEQAPTYQDEVEMTFNTFDGDLLTLSGEAGTCPSLSVVDNQGNPVSPKEWWLRHTIGEEIILDL